MKRKLGVLLLATTAACHRSGAPESSGSHATSASVTSATSATSRAEIGKVAPSFVLPDLDGHATRLDSFRGHIVVLEWFNPQCPFVRASHTKGSLKDTPSQMASKGIVWLAINSAASGKQGSGAEASRDGKGRFALGYPILLDETGEVGHAYGATNTPHMFVIDPQGVLVYGGAIDNSPDGEGESPQGGSLVNYVEAAVSDLLSGRPVRTKESKAYGCGVKYGS